MEAASRMQVIQKLNWTAIIFVGTLHFVAAYALYYGFEHGFSRGSWWLFGIFFAINMIGVSVGNHRFVTHGSFECALPVKLFLLIASAVGMQGHVIGWAANHRTHHAYADREGDPHSPKEGFWHAHIEWFLFKYIQPDENTMCPDLLKDRLLVSQKLWWIPVGWLIGFGVPYFLYGLDGLLLAGVLRLFLCLHATWLVNSACHSWGERPFATKDRSTNNKLLVWFTLIGEAYHNNHHADPSCAYLGWRRKDIDAGKWFIQLLAIPEEFAWFFDALGIRVPRLIWGVKKPRPEFMDKLYKSRKFEFSDKVQK